MKLASYLHEGRPGWGCVFDDGVAPLTATWPSLRVALADGIEAISCAVEAVPERLAANALAWCPPVPEPGKIICVGVNYGRHAAEAGRELPAHPSLFVRFADSFVGTGQPVVRPLASQTLDYEGELAVVIGRPARHVDPSDALAHVAGYCCLAENSVREFQRHAAQVTAGKNFEHSGSMGPWLVTTDEIGDPAHLRVMTRLNGQTVQDASVSDMLFGVPELIAYITRFTTLRPGDVIATGTPEGVGMSHRPPLWLRPGDLLEVEIPGIGVLCNPVKDETLGGQA